MTEVERVEEVDFFLRGVKRWLGVHPTPHRPARGK